MIEPSAGSFFRARTTVRARSLAREVSHVGWPGDCPRWVGTDPCRPASHALAGPDAEDPHLWGSTMTSHAAAVVSSQMVDVFHHVPEYRDYDHADSVRDGESHYRVALGRVAKAWGDQLLDLVENPRTGLTRTETRTIDALLERISEVFAQLNAFDLSEFRSDDTRRRMQLREADGAILDTVEEGSALMRDLRLTQGASLWLHDHAGAMYRRLRRLARQLERRNAVLGGHPVAMKKQVFGPHSDARQPRRARR